MSWIKYPLQLEGTKVILAPLEENHFEELIHASGEKIIWEFMPVDGTDKEKLKAALQEALLLREKGEQYPFVVIEKSSGKIIGSTRFLKINHEHRNLEIGWTWYLPSYWGKGYNEECKLLLLQHCFATLKTVRVQIVASERNLRSRKVIERIGATFEGVLRDIVIRASGKKSAAYYSILEEEWEAVQMNLRRLIEMKSE